MRHGKFGRTLGRKTNHRTAMWRNMAVSLFTHGQITTTVPKAKSVKPFVEKLISAAKQNDLAARRRVTKLLGQDHLVVRGDDDENVERNAYGEIATRGGKRQAPRVVKHLFEEIAPKYADRDGGYTRIIKLAKHRIGDGADLCVLQLVGDEDGPQVSGQFSRRREKADKRMRRAAALRKGKSEDTADAAEEAVEEPADTATAVAEAPEAEASAEAEGQTPEAPDEEAAPETEEPKKED